MLHKDVKKGFGLAIKNWRARSGMSQEELAWRAGVHRSYLADIERGARNASLQTIEKLARGLKVSFSTLFQPLGDFPAAGGVSRIGAHPDAPVDILLADNAPAVLETFETLRLTNSIQIARERSEALDAIFRKGSHSKRRVGNFPLLILLSLDLPKTAGLEVLRALKTDQRTRNIPVVVLARSRKDRELKEARRLGAQAHIIKPLDFKKFIEIIPRLNCKWSLLCDGG